jgi:hypothetical protein
MNALDEEELPLEALDVLLAPNRVATPLPPEPELELAVAPEVTVVVPALTF